MFNVAVRPLARAALSSSLTRIATPSAARTVTTLAERLYTAKGQASGQGRNGTVHLTEGGPFELKLAMPKSLGGAGDGHNPEQLFAMGYASCFLSALNLSAKQAKTALPANVTVDAHVSIGPPSSGPKPFAIAVDLIISSEAKDDEERKTLQKVVQMADDICPYSNAVRNNVPINLTVR